MTQRPRKAIIIAAGRGSRLMPYTDSMPKCMVPVDERCILGVQMSGYAEAGIEEVVVIRGYLGHVIEERQAEFPIPVRFIDNNEWEHNNILESLFCAEHELQGPVLLSYSDIIFTPAVTEAVCASDAEISLAIDTEFRKIYEGRTDHPLPEAEVALITDDGLVQTVGKRSLPPEEASGEFIGLAKLSPAAAKLFCTHWQKLRTEFEGRENEPYKRAPSFRRAYLTDLLQDLIDGGQAVSAVPIQGQWREIDTVQDLTRAQALLRSSAENWQ